MSCWGKDFDIPKVHGIPHIVLPPFFPPFLPTSLPPSLLPVDQYAAFNFFSDLTPDCVLQCYLPG